MADKTVILITGCSSGVGEAAAWRFLGGGHKVYATARRPETLSGLAGAGAIALPLDITDEESMTAAVKRVEDEHGAVGVLVNSAGYGVQGAMEVIPLDQARDQFETNLFGMIRLTQLALPAMRAKSSGRIVNVSAMGGHFSLPGTGILHASKHAVRAVSNAMRLELRAFGIAVSMVEPGPIRTAFAGKANATLPPPGSSPAYDRFHSELAARLDAAYEENKVLPVVLSPDTVARAIERAALARRPRARYPVGITSRYVIALSRILPDRALDAMVRQQFPVPGPLSPWEQRPDRHDPEDAGLGHRLHRQRRSPGTGPYFASSQRPNEGPNDRRHSRSAWRPSRSPRRWKRRRRSRRRLEVAWQAARLVWDRGQRERACGHPVRAGRRRRARGPRWRR